MNRYQKHIEQVLNAECTETEYQWIIDKAKKDSKSIRLGFVMTHRFVSGERISSGRLSVDDSPYSIDLTQWTKDQLCRTYLLLALHQGNDEDFHQQIETLFKTADNRESQALYASIPLFPQPDIWKQRATEAIRSNVGLIFDAMAFNNPYPAMYFDDIAWNQVVLKAIFSDKSIWRIVGIPDRRNEKLALTLSDFAHERWAAGRTLPADVWNLVAPYPGERYWEDVQILLSSESLENKKAGYLLWKEHRKVGPDHIKKTHHDDFQKLNHENVEWSDLKEVASS